MAVACQGRHKSVTEPELTIGDLASILESLYEARGEWYHIGLLLKIESDALDEIKEDSTRVRNYLCEVIKKWLKARCSPLTWENLCEVLRNKLVGRNDLAAKIEQQYITNRAPCKEPPVLNDDKPTNIRLLVPSESESSTREVTSSCADLSESDDQPKSKLTTMFEYLNLDELDDMEKLDLEGRLLREHQQINQKFAKLDTKVCRSLIDRKIANKELVRVLRQLKGYSSTREEGVLDDRYDEIKQAQDIDDIFDILRDYLSFFSYELLECIIEQLGTEEDRQALLEYKESFRDYCRRSVFECPSLSPPKKSFSKLIAKYDEGMKKSYSLNALKRLEMQISQVLKVSQPALRLCDAKPGCLELHYQIPTFIKDVIFPLSDVQKTSLKDLGIKQLSCNGIVHFTTLLQSSLQAQHSKEDQKELSHKGSEATGVYRRQRSEGSKKIFERPRGGDRSKHFTKECVEYKLLGDCTYGHQCRHRHERIVQRKSIGTLPYPVRLPKSMVIGRIGHEPNRAYVTQDSEANPDKEVIVIAENDEALEEAKKDLTILFAQLFPMRPGWTFIHNDGIVTPDLQIMFQEVTRRRLWFHQKRTAYEIVCRQKAGASKAATVDEIRKLHSSQHPHTDTMERVLEAVDQEGRNVSNVSRETTASARFRMMTDRKQFMEDLDKAFEWLNKPEIRKPEYTSKLEARFGKLAFSNLPDGLIAPDVSISVNEFAEFVFTDRHYKQIFNTNVKEENALQLRHHLGPSFSKLETYDMKLMAKNKGHLDVRIAFEHGKPRVLQLKKDEHKVVVFDFLCLHRNHDMRLSLSRFEVLPTSPPDAIMSSFLSHICLTPQGNLRLVPHTDTWTVSFIRHKKREVFPLLSNFVVSISEIEECQIKKHDMVLNQPLELTNYNKEHFEVEFHNLAWISAFGQEIGLTPRRSLSPLIEERAIRDWEHSLPEVDRPTDMILEDFDKEGVFEMIEGLNEGLGGIAT